MPDRRIYINERSAFFPLFPQANTIRESESIRDAFAKGLYSRLFDYVVQAVNKLLSYSLQVIT